jgi:hypothetical protein
MNYPSDGAIKKVGHLLAQAIDHLQTGKDVADRISDAHDEKQRELLEAMLAQSVHHSWASLMRVFRRIGHDFDMGIPKGKGAALRLLSQMESRTSERPSVISMRYGHSLRKITDFHAAFRRGDVTRHSPSALIEYLTLIHDEVAPDVISSVHVIAIGTPGGGSSLKHLPRTKHHTEESKKSVA